MRRRSLAVVLLLPWLALPASSAQEDPAAAERQYRVARRLAAEASPEAAAALRRVVDLAPRGELADDALLEVALLGPLPRWPEELGRIDVPAADQALGLVARVADEYAAADRSAEARYYRGLLLLEPLGPHDVAAARLSFLTAATDGTAGEWARRARFALGWLNEQLGDTAAARATYQRILVDAPGSVAASRAQVGLSRLDLRDGDPGRASVRLQQTGAGRAGRGAALKELAVRQLLRAAGLPGIDRAPSTVATLELRGITGFSADNEGGLLVADRRQAAVIAFGPSGAELARWQVESPLAIAVSPLGRRFVAAGRAIYRLEPGEPPIEVASQGDFAPTLALTVDALGTLWILDKRGERVGRIAPGAQVPAPIWQSHGAKLSALVWDGRRLVAIDGRGKGLLSIGVDGEERPLGAASFQRPSGLTTDPAGNIAVLDARGSIVSTFDSEGTALGTFSGAAAGIEKPTAVTLGPDGSLNLYDQQVGSWVRVP